MKTKFKVGQKVWDRTYGWGEIINIIDTDYPVWVKFKYTHVSYNFKGCLLISDNRTLFFEEIPIPESALKPKRWRAEKGEKYWCIDIQDIKKVFSSSEDGYCVDNDRYIMGNYFKTKEEAEKKLQKMLDVLKEEM